MKPDASGIMKIPEKGRIDFTEHFLKERLFTNGIDHRLIKNEKQLENILHTIDKTEANKLKQEADKLGLNDPSKNKFMNEGEVIEVDFGNWPEKKAQGGRTGSGLNYLLGEDDQNVRVPYAAGGFNKARRAFLKMMAGIGATGAAAKSGLFGLLKGGTQKSVIAPATHAANQIITTPGMPAWFKPLVNKVIKEGTEVPSGAERVIVHKTKLPNSKTDVYVEQKLDTGDVSVQIGMEKHGFPDGHLGQPVTLEYKASEIIEPSFTKNKETIGRAGETKPEFTVGEAEFTGGHPENIKFEEISYEKFGDHGSNFDEVEMFATGKVKKVKPTKKKLKTEYEQGKAEMEAESYEYEGSNDFASGGRVPLAGGKIVKGLAALANKIAPGSTKIGKTSKTMSPNTELKQAIAGFQERQNLAKGKETLREMLKEDIENFRGQVDDNIIREILAMEPAQQLRAIEDVKLYIRNRKNLKQELMLRDLDVTGLEPHATGGVAGMLGE